MRVSLMPAVIIAVTAFAAAPVPAAETGPPEGRLLRFPRPEVLRPLVQAGVGVEVMDVQAACRTYNILASEERRVAAALLFD